VSPEEARMPEMEKFHNDLRESLNPFSIETHLAWEPVREAAIERAAVHGGPRGLDRSREIQFP
jgi:hypothetical protein